MPNNREDGQSKAFEDYSKNIMTEVGHAERDYDRMLNDENVRNIDCVDPNCGRQDWNPAGGGIFLMNSNRLEEWMSNKPGGNLNVHLDCGYMTVVMNIRTLAGQKAKIAEFKALVEQLNSKFEKQFRVSVHDAGSAKSFVSR